MDECHFQQHGSRCAMWIPPEETDPVVLHAPTRKSVALFGAVNLRGGQLVSHFSEVFEAETFLAFLKSLLRRKARGKRMVVVSDNATYHHARALKPWLSAHRREIELLFLPPYSPNLNPTERVWKLLRRLCTHNEYFPELALLQNALTVQLKLWWRPNSVLHRLCCITYGAAYNSNVSHFFGINLPSNVKALQLPYATNFFELLGMSPTNQFWHTKWRTEE